MARDGAKARKKSKAAKRRSAEAGGGTATLKQARRDAVAITKLERAVTSARDVEEKRRRQLERALEGVQVAETKLRQRRTLLDARNADADADAARMEPTMSPSAQPAATTQPAKTARPKAATRPTTSGAATVAPSAAPTSRAATAAPSAAPASRSATAKPSANGQRATTSATARRGGSTTTPRRSGVRRSQSGSDPAGGN